MLIRFMLGVGAVCAAAGVVLIVVGETPIPLIVGLADIATALSIRILHGSMVRRIEGPRELRQRGARGVATVIEAVATNKHFGYGSSTTAPRVYRVRLQIGAEGMPAYELEKEMVVEVGPSGQRPGTKWPVFVDPADRNNVLVDWEALEDSG